MLRVVEEIVLTSPDAAPAPVESEVRLPDNDEALLRVDALRVGSWVEIQEDAEHKLRCKLAAVIRPTGRYIFVNRTGMKVLEKTRMGLAVEFRRQAVRLLDDALLFDRALESVIGNLRRLRAPSRSRTRRMPGLFVLAGNTFPRRMSKRPIQSPPDRHSGAAGLEWGSFRSPYAFRFRYRLGPWRPPLPFTEFQPASARDAVSLLVIHNISLPPGQFGTGKVQAFFQNRLTRTNIPISRRSAT